MPLPIPMAMYIHIYVSTLYCIKEISIVGIQTHYFVLVPCILCSTEFCIWSLMKCAWHSHSLEQGYTTYCPQAKGESAKLKSCPLNVLNFVKKQCFFFQKSCNLNYCQMLPLIPMAMYIHIYVLTLYCIKEISIVGIQTHYFVLVPCILCSTEFCIWSLMKCAWHSHSLEQGYTTYCPQAKGESAKLKSCPLNVLNFVKKIVFFLSKKLQLELCMKLV